MSRRSESALPWTLVLFTAILMAVTWRLWLPLGGTLSPRIPWLGLLRGVPAVLDWVWLILMGVGSLGLLLLNQERSGFRRAAALYSLGLSLLIAGDQHRLQPWAWQFLILGAVYSLATPTMAKRCASALVISIYAYSAISKFDAAFFEAHGQMLLQGALRPLGIEPGRWGDDSLTHLVWVFPIGELLTAGLLVWRRTRVWGYWCSVAMHLTLLWTLGLGLRHEWAVLIWNIFFLIQNTILFGPKKRAEITVSEEPESRPPEGLARESVAVALMTAVIAFPITNLWGICDHWPAWAVYCPRPAHVEVLVDWDAAQTAPAELQPFFLPPEPLAEEVQFSLDRWSFTTRSCPVYPQLRYRLALTRALLKDRIPNEAITVTIAHSPDRWTGNRHRETLIGNEGLEMRCQKFWLNTEVR